MLKHFSEKKKYIERLRDHILTIPRIPCPPKFSLVRVLFGEIINSFVFFPLTLEYRK
jgi:hypothetical protein